MKSSNNDFTTNKTRIKISRTRLLILLVLASFFQCTDQDSASHSCIEEPTPATGVSQSCSENLYPWYFCEVQDVGSFWLEESSKDFMPFYCLEKGSILRYKNNKNEEINFTLRNKVTSFSPSIYSTGKLCNWDTTKYIALCFKSDYVFIDLISQSRDLNLNINLSIRPEFNNGAHIGSGDFLEIYRKRDSIHYFQELQIVVHQGSLSYSMTYEQEFYEVLEIDGKLYRNIFTRNNSSAFPKKYTYYYSKTIGLVAFRDDNDVVWHLAN